jgi:hypothetical protein
MNKRILMLVSVYVAIILLYALLRPEEIDWTPTFAVEQTSPFASRILYEQLPDIRDELVKVTNRPVYNTLIDQAGSENQIYFLLNSEFQPQELDVHKLLEFASAGNTIFISSGRIGPQLLDTLGVRMEYQYTGSFMLTEWFYEDNLELSLTGYPETSWSAATSSGYMRFEVRDSSVAFDTIGYVNHEYPNFISRPFGEGQIFLHAFPYIFTNYHMLYQDNHKYVSAALGAIPGKRIWLWDQFYNVVHQRKAGSPLVAFNQYLSFRWAYWISVVGIVIFILFTAKRRQRIIPLIKPKRNLTLAFVRTIGDLYFQRGDHADLIEKKLDLLRAYLHKTYRIDVVDFTPDDATHLALRSGLPTDDIHQCFSYIRNLPHKKEQRSSTIWELQHVLDKLINPTRA